MSFKLPTAPKTDWVGGFTDAVADIRAKLVDEAWFGRTDAAGARQVDIWSTLNKDEATAPEAKAEPEAEADKTAPDLEPEL